MRKSTTKGFRATGTLLRDSFRKVGEKRGFAETRILTQWTELVGSEIARMARPIDIKFAKAGLGSTLRLLVSPAHAPIVEMQRESLRAKLNAVYGYNAITRIQITQTSAQGFAEAQAAFALPPTQPKAQKAQVNNAVQTEARVIAQDVADEGLQRALASLARNVLSKTKT